MPKPGRFFVNCLLPEIQDQDLKEYFNNVVKIRVTQANVVIEKETLMSRCCGWVSVADEAVLQGVFDSEHSIWDQAIKVKAQPDPDDGDNLEPPPIVGRSPAGSVGKCGKGAKPMDKGGLKGGKNIPKFSMPEYGPPIGADGGSGAGGEIGWFQVEGLDPEVGEEQLNTFFSAFGGVEQLEMDGSGSASVKMEDALALEVVLSSTEYDMDGQTITVRPAGKGGTKRPCKGGFGKPAASYGKGCGSLYGKEGFAKGGQEGFAKGGKDGFAKGGKDAWGFEGDGHAWGFEGDGYDGKGSKGPYGGDKGFGYAGKEGKGCGKGKGW